MSKPEKLAEDLFKEEELPVTPNGGNRRQNLLGLEKRYKFRFTHVKQAKEAQKSGNFLQAVKKYHEYLKVLSDLHECDPYKLKPSYFNRDNNVAEMFLISQVYWELTKMYDLTPKLQPQFMSCLKQFIFFSNNMPYQIVNAEIMRRFIKRGKLNNVSAYQEAYNSIYIASKSCFIATECFGDLHPTTERIRHFKALLMNYTFGVNFVHFYYRISPTFIDWLRARPRLRNILLRFIFRPTLNIFSKFF
ncbi:MAG: hypothetical protein JNM93_09570 [Bacteriovoracaceae bacterium]|nr:hypothetical protein [Bacteriovoracaceae bacterium]